jgi:hypothetical protein
MARVGGMAKVPVTFNEPLTTVDAARRLGVDVSAVYALIFSGRLLGGPDRSGDVKVEASSVEALLRTGEAGPT